MDERHYIIAFVLVLVIFLIILCHFKNKKCKKIAEIQKPAEIEKPVEPVEPVKIAKILDTYFTPNDPSKSDNTVQLQNEYIASLPMETGCSDNYDDCAKWAARGECIINPEFMLYNCTNSCEACGLTYQQKYNVAAIYNTRAPPSCAYHGQAYPDPLTYRLNTLRY